MTTFADNTRIFECFKVGTHTSMGGNTAEWTALDLEKITRNHHFLANKPPLVLGHPASDGPVYGEVNDLFVKNDILYAVAKCSTDLIDMVRKGLYKNVSCAFKSVPDLPGWSLRHIGFLGGATPAVQGLAPLAFAERYDATGAALCFAASSGSLSLGEYDFQPPIGWKVEHESMLFYKKIKQVAADCPSLSFAEAAGLAQKYLIEF